MNVKNFVGVLSSDASTTMSNCIKMQLHFRSTMSSDFCMFGMDVGVCEHIALTTHFPFCPGHTWLGRIARQVHICPKTKRIWLLLNIRNENGVRLFYVFQLCIGFIVKIAATIARLTDERAHLPNWNMCAVAMHLLYSPHQNEWHTLSIIKIQRFSAGRN